MKEPFTFRFIFQIQPSKPCFTDNENENNENSSGNRNVRIYYLT